MFPQLKSPSKKSRLGRSAARKRKTPSRRLSFQSLERREVMDAHGLLSAAEPVWIEDPVNHVCVMAPQGEGETPAPAPMPPAQAAAHLVAVLRQLNDFRDEIASPTDEQSKEMDVNGDGILTVADAVVLIEHIRARSDVSVKVLADAWQQSENWTPLFSAMVEDIAAAQFDPA